MMIVECGGAQAPQSGAAETPPVPGRPADLVRTVEPGRALSAPRSRGRLSRVLAALCLAVAPVLAGCTTPESEVDRPDASTPGPESTTGPGSPPGNPDDLLSRLRAGGLVLVFRHATTDRSQQDADERGGTLNFDDCGTQRNLSERGRTDAATIGAAFRELAIPVGKLWASPFCRSRDTARLAFGDRAEVVPGLERLYPTPDQAAQARLNKMIRESAPAPGEPNLVIVSHGVYPSVLSPAVALGEGEGAIYSVRGNDVALLGRLQPGEWADLD